MERILLLDISNSSTGFVVYNFQKQETLEKGRIEKENTETITTTLRKTYLKIKRICEKHNVDMIIKEAFVMQHGRTNIKTLMTLNKMHAIVDFYTEDVESVHPATIKSALSRPNGLNSVEIKRYNVKKANEVFDEFLTEEEHDVADAYTVLLGYVNLKNKELDAKRKERIKTLKKKRKTLKTEKTIEKYDQEIEELTKKRKEKNGILHFRDEKWNSKLGG